MAVDVSANPAFQAGIPQPAFDLPPTPVDPEVTPDGRRVLTAAQPLTTVEGPSKEIPINVVLNWPALLKK